MKKIESIIIETKTYIKFVNFNLIGFSFYISNISIDPPSSKVNDKEMNSPEKLFKILKFEVEKPHFISIKIQSSSGIITVTSPNPKESHNLSHILLVYDSNEEVTKLINGWKSFIGFLKKEYEYLS